MSGSHLRAALQLLISEQELVAHQARHSPAVADRLATLRALLDCPDAMLARWVGFTTRDGRRAIREAVEVAEP